MYGPGSPGTGRYMSGERSLPAAVLIDVDGTLVDTNYLHAVTWWQAFGDAGHTVEMAEIHRAIGMGSDHLLDHLLGENRDRSGDEGLSDAHTRYYRGYWERLASLPGAADLLRTCHVSGLRVVLSSSAKPDEMAVLRRAIGADDAIDEVVSSGDVESTKPAPDLVEVALRKAGVRAGQALFIGDSVWDVHAAARAGVPCLALTCGGTSAAELRDAGAVSVHDNPADLLRHLDTSPLSGLRPRGGRVDVAS